MKQTNMKQTIITLLTALLFAPLAVLADGTPEEMTASDQWFAKKFKGSAEALPFSFTFDGQPSAALLKEWKLDRSERKLDDRRTETVLAWTDPKSGLQVRCVAVLYHDFPAVEWTAFFKNTGTKSSPILENIQGLDTVFHRPVADKDGPSPTPAPWPKWDRWRHVQPPSQSEFVLHGMKGDFCSAESYTPYQLTLAPKTVKKLGSPHSGKSCDGPDGWPYYNLQMPGGGVLLGIGWPGCWSSSFTRDAGTELRIQAGQALTRLRLHPGEEVRSPLIAMVFWKGSDVARSQNLWRRWMLDHNLPKSGGRPFPPHLLACSSHQFANMLRADEASQKQFIDGYRDRGIKLDYWWMDAGWYPCLNGIFSGDGACLNTGTWEPDRTRFPRGLKPISDHAREQGVGTVVWFEPERVGDLDSWLAKNHPEWLLPELRSTAGAIFNLGHPEALNWLINHVDQLIKTEGIDWYREDMNGGGPGPAWRDNDAPNRQGITENLYIQGHLAFWDELVRRNPGLRIDSCASGGRRNDLETMRRAVPLLRSDYIFEPAGQQAHTYALSSWLPYHGTGMSPSAFDAYVFRSCMAPGVILSYDMRPGVKEDFALEAKLCDQWRRLAPAMLGDYYPLTGYSLAKDQWMAWQFDRPESGEGIVQVFRREESPGESARFKLRGLDATAKYEVENLDGGKETHTGRELMEKGLAVTINQQPAALVFAYKRVK